jgi:hypothetical protein
MFISFLLVDDDLLLPFVADVADAATIVGCDDDVFDCVVVDVIVVVLLLPPTPAPPPGIIDNGIVMY